MYSMGCLLWELYACERAWAGLLPPQVIIKVGIQKQRLPPLAGAPPEFQARAPGRPAHPWGRPQLCGGLRARAGAGGQRRAWPGSMLPRCM